MHARNRIALCLQQGGQAFRPGQVRRAHLELGEGALHGGHLALLEAAVFVRSHPQAIEYGGDAGRGDLRVMRLRRKVERNADKPEVIKTVRNVGYVYVPRA